MQSPFFLYAVYLFLSAALTLAAAVVAWRRKAPGSLALGFLLLSMTFWSFFYALQWLPFAHWLKLLLPNITFIGVAAIPTLFLIFALSFTHHESWLTGRRRLILAVEPLVTLLLAWTNSRHHTVFETVFIQDLSGFSQLKLVHGPWYTVNLFYSYAVIIAGLLVLVYGMWRSSPLMRSQYLIILLAAMIPWGMSIYNEYSIWSNDFDFAPFAFGVSAILFTLSIIRTRFMDIIPVARSRLIESMSDGILVLDDQNRIVDANPAMAGFLSQNTALLVGRPAAEVLDRWMANTDGLLSGAETRMALRFPDLPPRYADLRVTPLFDPDQQLSGHLIVFHDITDHKYVERELRYANKRLQSQLIEIGTLQSKLRSQAIHDPLTDLFNRRYLDETLDRELARASREGYPLCIIMMDIDHFKKINDTHGHEAGDLILKALARTLVIRNRRGDFSCRFGGEEFVVVMPNIALDAAYRRAEELRLALNSVSVPFGEDHVSITISMGIACYPANGMEREALLRAADRAMYAAKRAGRDYILTYDHLESQSGLVSY